MTAFDPLILAPVVVLAGVLGFATLGARLSPWRELVARYPAPARFTGETMVGCGVKGGSSFLPSVLTVGGCAEGVYLGPWSWLYGAVLVPWEDVVIGPPFVPWGHMKLQAEEFRELQLGAKQPVRLQLGRYVVEWLESLASRPAPPAEP